MTTKLTKKDEKLLIFLGAMLLFVATLMWVVMPGMSGGQELEDRIMDAEIAKQEMEDKINQGPLLKQDNKVEKKKWKEVSSRYYDKMESQEVDRLLTELLLGEGLEIKLLTLSSEPQLAALESYQPYGNEENSAMDYTAIWVSSAGFEVTGDREKLTKLVDKLSDEYPAIHMLNYSYGGLEEDGKKTAQLSVALEVYMKGTEKKPEAAETKEEQPSEEASTEA